MSEDATLLEVLEEFASAGYEADFFVTDDAMVKCRECGAELAPETLVLDSLRRLEGASDPDDMLAVLALTCPRCGAKGTAVVHFGPEASEAEGKVMLAVEDDRPRR